jgi:Family of unknown function (DUF5677)
LIVSENPLTECVEYLDLVTGRFLEARDCATISEYEADRAAFALLQSVFVHVNALSHLAAWTSSVPHLPSAWVLARAAFETGVVALWLCKENDWKEREARFLGWVLKREEHLESLAADFTSIEIGRSDVADRCRKTARDYARWREAVTGLLPKDSRMKCPSFFQMVKEIGLDRRYYMRYRMASSVIHGAPQSLEHVLRVSNTQYTVGSFSTGSDLAEIFRLASWCIVAPAQVVLVRNHVDPAKIGSILSAHKDLLGAADRL